MYRAEHAQLGTPAALKLLHRELATSREAVLRFEREAEAVRAIRHPNVIDLFAVGSHDGTPYLVMELLTGQDLHSRLEENGRLTIEETLRILEPVCSALAAAHARGIVHRDIKASNVFLHEGPEGSRVVLLDFGVAKLLAVDDTSLTASHQAVGTPACMAPEQIVGGEITTRTDVYGLAVLGYHMITGLLPFAGASATMMQHMHLEAERPRPSSIVPCAAPIDMVLQKAMSRRAELRHPSVGAFLDELRATASPRMPVPDARRSEPAIGVHVAIDAARELLESPDNRLLEDIDAVGFLIADALEAAGFAKVLDTCTAVLFVRRCPPERGRPEELRETLDLIEAVLASLDARPDRDGRVSVCVAVRAASEHELLDSGSWVPVGPSPGIRVIE